MVQYKGVYKDRYEYSFRVCKEFPDHFEYLTWDNKWVKVDKIEEYTNNPYWVIVAIN